MSVKGSLKEMSLDSIVSVNCNELNQARLRLSRQGTVGSLYLADGKVVHAELDSLVGREAVHEMLTWEDGEFELEMGVTAADQTITSSWSGLLLEGMKLIDERNERQVPPKETEDVIVRKDKREMATQKRSEMLAGTLSDMLAASNDIVGAVVVTSDGLVIASQLPKGADESRIGASAAALHGLSKRSTPALGRGEFTQNLIQGTDGNIVITNVNAHSVFVGLTAADVNLGMVFLETRDAAKKIDAVLTE